MIRFPTHDGRGGFRLALSSQHESALSRDFDALSPRSHKSRSTKGLSTQASTSSSILDDALPRQPHPSSDLSQRIHAWAQEQRVYARLRHNKRRRLSVEAGQRIRREGLEGWLWRFVSRLIGMDDHLLQIVLGEKLVEAPAKPISEQSSIWDGFRARTALENTLASPFLSPQFQRIFRQNVVSAEPTLPFVTTSPRPARQPASTRDSPRRQASLPQPSSSWSSFSPDPIQTAPFKPSPIHLPSEPLHAPWGIEDNDIFSPTAELPDDYWDRELTIPIVWHIVKNYISSRLPGWNTEGMRGCKEESVHWEEEERSYYWHESVDGVSSLGLGLSGMHGTWAEV